MPTRLRQNRVSFKRGDLFADYRITTARMAAAAVRPCQGHCTCDDKQNPNRGVNERKTSRLEGGELTWLRRWAIANGANGAVLQSKPEYIIIERSSPTLRLCSPSNSFFLFIFLVCFVAPRVSCFTNEFKYTTWSALQLFNFTVSVCMHFFSTLPLFRLFSPRLLRHKPAGL